MERARVLRTDHTTDRRINDDQTPLPPRPHRDRGARRRGFRRLLRAPRWRSRHRERGRQDLPALLGRLLQLQPRDLRRARAGPRRDGLAHDERRSARRGGAAYRSRGHHRRMARLGLRPRPVLHIHGAVRAHHEAVLGCREVPRRGRVRLDLPRPPRAPVAARGRTPPTRPRHHRRPRRHGVRRVVPRCPRVPDHGVHVARRGPHHGLRGHHHEREVARPRRGARHVAAPRPHQPLRVLGRHP